MSQFKRTTTLNKIKALTKFVRAIQGGTSSGKTFAILPILIDIACKEKDSLITVASESLPHLKRGAITDFVNIMKETGRWKEESFYRSSPCYYQFANGSKIEFVSAKNAATLRGARREYLFLNECNHLSFEAYNELASRTKKGIWMDWNPSGPFWFNEHLEKDENVDHIVVTYMDNEVCPESAKNYIEQAKKKAEDSEYWANWYRVYGLGEMGTLVNQVYEFNIVDGIPSAAESLAVGLDFGFSNDPSAAVKLYKFNNEIYVDQLLYATNLTNADIYNRLIQVLKPHELIVADSSEPKSIFEINQYGLKGIEGVVKGKDSIDFGINLIRAHKLNVTARSIDLIKELRNYQYAKDNSGKLINKAVGVDHALDAMRYAAMKTLVQNNFKYTFL